MYLKIFIVSLLTTSLASAECLQGIKGAFPSIDSQIKKVMKNVNCSKSEEGLDDLFGDESESDSNTNTNSGDVCACELSKYAQSEITEAKKKLDQENLRNAGDRALALFAGHSGKIISSNLSLDLFGQKFSDRDLKKIDSCRVENLDTLVKCDQKVLAENLPKLYGNEVKTLKDLKEKLRETKESAQMSFKGESFVCQGDPKLTNNDLRQISLFYSLEKNSEGLKKEIEGIQGFETLGDYLNSVKKSGNVSAHLETLLESSELLRNLTNSKIFFTSLKNSSKKTDAQSFSKKVQDIFSDPKIKEELYANTGEKCGKTLKQISDLACGNLTQIKLSKEKYNDKANGGNVNTKSLMDGINVPLESVAFCANQKIADFTYDLDALLDEGSKGLPAIYQKGISWVENATIRDNSKKHFSDDQCSYSPSAEIAFVENGCSEKSSDDKCLKIKAQRDYFRRLKDSIAGSGLLKKGESVEEFLKDPTRDVRRSEVVQSYVFDTQAPTESGKFYVAKSGTVQRKDRVDSQGKPMEKVDPPSKSSIAGNMANVQNQKMMNAGNFASDGGASGAVATSGAQAASSGAINSDAFADKFMRNMQKVLGKDKTAKALADMKGEFKTAQTLNTLKDELSDMKVKQYDLDNKKNNLLAKLENEKRIRAKEREIQELENRLAAQRAQKTAYKNDRKLAELPEKKDSIFSNPVGKIPSEILAKPSISDVISANDISLFSQPAARKIASSKEALADEGVVIELDSINNLTIDSLLNEGVAVNKAVQVKVGAKVFDIVLVAKNGKYQITPLNLLLGKELPKDQWEILNSPALKEYKLQKHASLKAILKEMATI